MTVQTASKIRRSGAICVLVLKDLYVGCHGAGEAGGYLSVSTLTLCRHAWVGVHEAENSNGVACRARKVGFMKDEGGGTLPNCHHSGYA